MYEYKAELIRVVDGDTVDLNVDLGFGVWRQDRFRLYGPNPAIKMGMDAPEMSTGAPGKAAKFALFEFLHSPTVPYILTIQTVKDRQEKFGRYMAVIFRDSNGKRENVNQLMLDGGFAKLKEF